MSRTLTVLGTAGALGSFKVSASANHCRSFGASRPGHLLASPHLLSKKWLFGSGNVYHSRFPACRKFPDRDIFSPRWLTVAGWLKPSEARLVQNNTAHTA